VGVPLFQFKVMDQATIPWDRLDSFPDRTIFQTQPWLEFLKVTQGVKPLVIEITQGETVVGYFTGALFKKFGVRILGSSFPGWTTAHMGFNLLPDTPLDLVAQELIAFAFSVLKCWHIEINDKHLRIEQINNVYPAARHRVAPGWIVDIGGTEDAVFKRMSSNRRRCIKKGTENGLIVEMALDESFCDDYYSQLVDVFKRQGLVPTYSKERVRQLIRHLLPTGQLLLVRVREPETGLCIGSGLFPAFNGTMYFWGGASLQAELHHHPNESMHWFAIRYWREKGMTSYDMGGGGDYKRRYGGRYIETHWIRVSRMGLLMSLRDRAQGLAGLIQRLRGRFVKSPSSTHGA